MPDKNPMGINYHPMVKARYAWDEPEPGGGVQKSKSPGAGWQPIPRGKKGGWRKPKSGGGYSYRYDDSSGKRKKKPVRHPLGSLGLNEDKIAHATMNELRQYNERGLRSSLSGLQARMRLRDGWDLAPGKRRDTKQAIANLQEALASSEPKPAKAIHTDDLSPDLISYIRELSASPSDWSDLTSARKDQLLEWAAAQPDGRQGLKDALGSLYWMDVADPTKADIDSVIKDADSQRAQREHKLSAQRERHGGAAKEDARTSAVVGEVRAAVGATRTYMEQEESSGNSISFGTRENGNVGDEEHSQLDVREALRVRDALKAKFGDGIKATVGTVDEWVTLDIKIQAGAQKSMAHINPLDLVKGNITLEEAWDSRFSKGAGDDEVEASEEEEEEEEDPAAAEAAKEAGEAGEEEEEEKSMSALDLVKHRAPEPKAYRLGSVTYHTSRAAQLVPERSRPSLPAPRDSVAVSVASDGDPLQLLRQGTDGVLVHPNGARRRG